MKPVVYHPAARSEMIESALFYDERKQRLGDRFLAAVAETTDWIRSYPEQGSPLEGDLARRRVEKFPFGVVYKEYDDHIFVVAVAHFSRRPGYWKERLDDMK